MRNIEANIITIPAGVITGYLWLSDRQPDEVEVYDNAYREEVVLDASKIHLLLKGNCIIVLTKSRTVSNMRTVCSGWQNMIWTSLRVKKRIRLVCVII